MISCLPRRTELYTDAVTQLALTHLQPAQLRGTSEAQKTGRTSGETTAERDKL